MLRFKRDDGSEYSDWEIIKHKNILVDTRLGGNYENITELTSKPLIKMGNIGRGNIILEKIEYIPENIQVSNEDKLIFGDLLFNTRNTLELVGKVAIWKDELPLAYYNSNLLKLKYKQNKIYNNFFMNYLFNSFKTVKELRRKATGSTSVAAIYTKDLANIKFLIPTDLEEQQKIADFLSEVDNIIVASEQEIESLEMQKKGAMQKIFSKEVRFKADDGSEYPEWEEKRLPEIATLLNGRAYKSEEMLSFGKYPLLRVGNLFSNDNLLYSDLELEEDKYINDGDLIYAWSATFGPRIFHGSKTIYHYHIWKVIPKEISAKFLYILLLNDVKYIKRELNGGTMQHITKADMEKRIYVVPCLEEQQKIADFLLEFDNAIEYAKEELEVWKNIKKGLLQQMFE